MTPPAATTLGSEIGSAALGMTFLLGYVALFTVGSQVSSQHFTPPKNPLDAVMFVLTYRESSVCVLGIVASCLGMWRRLNQDGSEPPGPWFLSYTSACINGLILSGVVVALPNMIDAGVEIINISRDPAGGGQRNYISMAMLASVVAFLSGYDRTVFDRILAMFAKRLGLGAATGSTPQPGAQSALTDNPG
jgi:hypothetical protein